MSERTRVLLIEGDSPSRAALASLIQADGVEIFEAENSASGLEALAHSPFEIVFVDGDLTEPQTLQRIAESQPKPLLCVFTRTKSQADLEQLVQAGSISVLNKPLDADAVKALFNRFVWSLRSQSRRRFNSSSLVRGAVELVLTTSEQAISPTVRTLVSLLTGFVEPEKLRTLEVAFHEVLRNALEHGNLGLSSEEKTKHYATGRYENMVEEMAKKAQLAGQCISVRATIECQEFALTVSDEGKGFDWSRVMARADKVQDENSVHGRGLFLIKNAFDSVSFNESGNSITLKVRLPG